MLRYHRCYRDAGPQARTIGPAKVHLTFPTSMPSGRASERRIAKEICACVNLRRDCDRRRLIVDCFGHYRVRPYDRLSLQIPEIICVCYCVCPDIARQRRRKAQSDACQHAEDDGKLDEVNSHH